MHCYLNMVVPSCTLTISVLCCWRQRYQGSWTAWKRQENYFGFSVQQHSVLQNFTVIVWYEESYLSIAQPLSGNRVLSCGTVVWGSIITTNTCNLLCQKLSRRFLLITTNKLKKKTTTKQQQTLKCNGNGFGQLFFNGSLILKAVNKCLHEITWTNKTIWLCSKEIFYLNIICLQQSHCFHNFSCSRISIMCVSICIRGSPWENSKSSKLFLFLGQNFQLNSG